MNDKINTLPYSSSDILETPRLQLISYTKEMLDAYFKGEPELAKLMGITIPSQWTIFGEGPFHWTYKELDDPRNKQWLSYMPVLKEKKILIGNCGFKGYPKDGIVEIGYEVANDYRGKGFATEMAAALIKYAFGQPGVLRVQAHTLAEENESVAVLRKCGMKKMEELEDPDDGKIWRWELHK